MISKKSRILFVGKERFYQNKRKGDSLRSLQALEILVISNHLYISKLTPIVNMSSKSYPQEAKNYRDGPFCVDCRTKKESSFCVNCQKETSDLFQVQIKETGRGRESIGIKQKRQGFKGFIKKIFQGYKPSGDSRFSDGVDVQMIIDREKNEYHHIVKDSLTGKIIHEEHEPLDQHKSKNEKTNKK